MTGPLTGGCQCGRIRYASTTANRAGYWCHCRMCQRASGNLAISFLGMAKETLQWEAAPDRYASSPIAERLFCSRCGTHLGFAYLDSANIDITAGSLDHPELLTCESHFGVESRHAAWWPTAALPEQRADAYANLRERWAKAGLPMP
jgi:hypothetical protein